jgi:predicted nucleic acid-binding protein
MALVVDTDVVVDLLRQYAPAVAWLNGLEDTEILLPGFVVMELIQGCRTQAEQKRLQKALAPYGVIWPAADVCDLALAVFARFYLSHSLGIIDALIGQLAVSLDLPLYSFNQKHYLAIPGLRVIQPYPKV